jgi:hypothetical protein
MFLLKQVLPAAIIAMTVAASICAFALFRGGKRTRIALDPIAGGIAYFVGHFFVVGWLPFPPTDTTNWLPWFGLVTAILSAYRAGWTMKAWVRPLIFFLVSAVTLRLLLNPKFQYGWSFTEGYVWVVCLAAAMVLVASILDALVRRRPAMAIEVPAFLLIICAGTFGSLMLSGSMLLGQFAAVLGAVVFGCLVLTTRRVALDRGIVPVFSLLLVTLLLSGYFFAELPAASAALIAFAPVFALIPTRMPTFPGFGVRAALISVPILVGLVVAFRSSPPLSY